MKAKATQRQRPRGNARGRVALPPTVTNRARLRISRPCIAINTITSTSMKNDAAATSP